MQRGRWPVRERLGKSAVSAAAAAQACVDSAGCASVIPRATRLASLSKAVARYSRNCHRRLETAVA